MILLVYSCVFSRGVDAVRGDMDNGFDEPPPLMASHGYASQVPHATSNNSYAYVQAVATVVVVVVVLT